MSTHTYIIRIRPRMLYTHAICLYKCLAPVPCEATPRSTPHFSPELRSYHALCRLAATAQITHPAVPRLTHAAPTHPPTHIS